MKLVFLSHVSDCAGGAQRCLLDLLRGLKHIHPDWQLYMVLPGPGDLLDACSPYIDGYRFLQMEWWLVGKDMDIGTREKLSYIRKLSKYSIKLTRYLRRIKPDYGMTNTVVFPHLAISCKMLGIKHCWFIHEIPDVTWLNLNPVFEFRFIFRAIDKLSNKILVTSRYAEFHYQKVMTSAKISSITQAVELPMTVGVDVKCDRHTRYTILLVGAFDSNKGQMELLQAVKRIVAEGKDILCYLVGPDVGFMPKCQKYIQDNGLDNNVKIVSYTQQVVSYYALADVVLVCSTFETFGRVAVEAQKCGLPLILSDVGANPERIEDGVNGLLYQKGNIAELAEKIEMLRDENVRKMLSKNIDSIAIEEKYGIDNFASSFCTLLGL